LVARYFVRSAEITISHDYVISYAAVFGVCPADARIFDRVEARRTGPKVELRRALSRSMLAMLR
jgi:hypothetical protein